MSELVKNPKSDSKVCAALVAANTKQQSIPSGDRFLKTTTNDDLVAQVVSFPEKVGEMTAAESDEINLVNLSNIALEKLKMQSTFYLDTVNAKISFGTYPASVRVNFLMSADSKVLPAMGSVSEILEVAAVIKTGDLVLIAMGLTPPLDFTAAENDALHTVYNSKSIAANTAKEVFATKEREVAAAKIVSAKLCVTIRTELEFHCVDFSDSAMRDYCRLWGVKYDTKKGITDIDILAVYADRGEIAPGTVIRIGQVDTKATKKVLTPSTKGATGTVNVHGTLTLETAQTGALFLICNQTGCNELIVPITIVEGEDQSVTVHLIRTPPEV